MDVLELLTTDLGGETFYLCHFDRNFKIKKIQQTKTNCIWQQKNPKTNNIPQTNTIIFILQDLIQEIKLRARLYHPESFLFTFISEEIFKHQCQIVCTSMYRFHQITEI